MIEMVRLTIRFIELLFFLLVSPLIFILGLVARVMWWWERYFLGPKICKKAHEYLSDSWRGAWKEAIDDWKRATKPSDESRPEKDMRPHPHSQEEAQKSMVRGFFFTLVWPLLICLHVLLAAQILSIWFKAGTRIELPWFGAYNLFPLTMGFLFAIAQTLLCVLHECTRGRWSRFFLKVMIVLSFLVESGLAAYRAWLLSTEEIMISETMWDAIMLRGGIVLAGFLGFLVPLVESLIGAVSFLEFIEPVSRSLLQMIKLFLHLFDVWSNMVMLLVRYAGIWWVCGFHSKEIVTIPATVNNLKEETDNLDSKAKELKRNTDDLQKKIDEWKNDIPESFDEQKNHTEGLEKDVDRTLKEWDVQKRKIRERIREVEDFDELERIERDIEDKSRDMLGKAELLQGRSGRLYDSIGNSSHRIGQWNIREKGCFLKQWNENENEADNLIDICTKLETYVFEIKNVLSNTATSNLRFLISADVDELQELDPNTKREINRIVNGMQDKIERVRRDLKNEQPRGIKETLVELKDEIDGIDKRIPPRYPEAEKVQLMEKAQLIEERIIPKLKADISTNREVLIGKCRCKRIELAGWLLRLFLLLNPWYWKYWRKYWESKGFAHKASPLPTGDKIQEDSSHGKEGDQ